VLSVDRERKKDGRRLDRFYFFICINAMYLQVHFICHFLPVSSGFHFHTRAFRSLLRVFIAQPTVRDVTQHTPHHGYNAVAGVVWLRQLCTACDSAPAPDKIGRKGGKGEIMWAHTYPTVSSRPRGRYVQSLVPIGSEMWICIRYKQTNKQTNFHLYI
jgi:hypothetical protein